MKKVLIGCIIIIMALTLTMPVFASRDDFVDSPSRRQAPILIEGKNEDDDCMSKITLYSYAERYKLPEEARTRIEVAYTQIIEVDSLDQFDSKIAKLANEADVSVQSLAVIDIFEISSSECDSHKKHGSFNIIIEPDTFKNFVCLLHFVDGKWEVVDGAKVTNDGTYIEFNEDDFSPFAIVVSSETVAEPEKNNTALIIVAGVVCGVTAFGAGAWVAVAQKKRIISKL